MRRLLKLFRKRKFQTVLDSELRFHVEQKTSDLIAQGVDPAEARRRAMAKLGGMEAIKQEYRESRATHFLESIFQDIRYALRTLRRSPRFTAVAILTLALGIGANTAIFSLVEAVLLRPLPYPRASRLVDVWAHSDVFDFPYFGLSLPDLADIQKQSRSFEHLAVWGFGNANLTGQGGPEELSIARVSAGFFPLFGVPPLHGRTFLRSEVQPGHDHVVMLSAKFWRKHFGADPHAIGSGIQLNAASYTVVGDGRLAPGSTIAQAQAELNPIAARLARAFPKADKGWGFGVQSMKSHLIGDTRTPLLVLFGAVGLVLLIACANVGNLYLALPICGSLRRRAAARGW